MSKRSILVLLPSLLTLIVAGCRADVGDEDVGTTSDALQQCVTDKVEGVDVSGAQGNIDWVAAKGAGIGWAAMKATQGYAFVASNFARNWEKAKEAGVLPSAYHFFEPNKDGVQQAEHFLATMGPLRVGDLPPMLDLECPDGSARCLGYEGGSGQAPPDVILQRSLDWLRKVEAATGMKPIVYTYPSFFRDNGIDPTPLLEYPLFLASLTTTSCFNVPAPYTKAAMWQYSWTGHVAGISGEVDRDRFIGKMQDLLAMTKQPE